MYVCLSFDFFSHSAQDAECLNERNIKRKVGFFIIIKLRKKIYYLRFLELKTKNIKKKVNMSVVGSKLFPWRICWFQLKLITYVSSKVLRIELRVI